MHLARWFDASLSILSNITASFFDEVKIRYVKLPTVRTMSDIF